MKITFIFISAGWYLTLYSVYSNIKTKELNQTLKKSETLLLVDPRPFTEYSEVHIQGAVNLNLFQFHHSDTSKTGIKQFENQSRILLSNLGVKKSQQVGFL